jgi:MFS transporter, ACS family, tartrate transporter
LTAGIALINGFANLGGFFGPYLIGWLKSATGGFDVAMVMLGCVLALNAVIVLALERGYRRQRGAADAPGVAVPQDTES